MQPIHLLGSLRNPRKHGENSTWTGTRAQAWTWDRGGVRRPPNLPPCNTGQMFVCSKSLINTSTFSWIYRSAEAIMRQLADEVAGSLAGLTLALPQLESIPTHTEWKGEEEDQVWRYTPHSAAAFCIRLPGSFVNCINVKCCSFPLDQIPQKRILTLHQAFAFRESVNACSLMNPNTPAKITGFISGAGYTCKWEATRVMSVESWELARVSVNSNWTPQ